MDRRVGNDEVEKALLRNPRKIRHIRLSGDPEQFHRVKLGANILGLVGNDNGIASLVVSEYSEGPDEVRSIHLLRDGGLFVVGPFKYIGSAYGLSVFEGKVIGPAD